MNYFVYILITYSKDRYISYVGYTSNINKRINAHNSSKGAKFTKGRKWKIIYKKKFNTKSEAMKAEIKLKKNLKFRSKVKNKYIKNVNQQSTC
tara:strand:- start:1046 stop:1324 length:279 start_codon:yes stop_codon:yes gene_type:complete